tara:strand:+ start:237 stop:572 length:336 start_codon:yes stop_codon:yes gene_type:complete
MDITKVMNIIEKDMQLPENRVAGELFLCEISLDESSRSNASKVFKEWTKIKKNPDLYEFICLCDQVKMQLNRDEISEPRAIELIHNLGCYHRGFPTDVEVLDFLYDNELDI